MIHAIALSVSAGLAVWAATRVGRRRAAGVTSFVRLSVAIAIWTAAGAGHALAGDVAVKVWWAKLQYVGIASVAPLWLLFTAEFSGVRWLADARTRRWLWIVPGLTIAAALTNEWHRALWTGVALRPNGAAD